VKKLNTLKSQILFYSIIGFLSIIIPLTFVIIEVIRDNEIKVTTSNMENVVERYTSEVSKYVDNNDKVVETFKFFLENNKSKNRTEIVDAVKDIMQKNKSMVGLYVSYLENAFDGLDKKFINDIQNGGNEIGRFSFYWNTISGELQLEPTTEDELNNDWFNLPMKTGKNYILEPYYDQGIMMTSHNYPIISDNKVIAVAGADVSLNQLSDLTKSIKVFESGYAILVSNEGLIMGYHDTTYLGKMNISDWLSNFELQDKEKVISDLKKGYTGKFIAKSLVDNKNTVIYHNSIPRANWNLLIAVPEDELFAGTNNLTWMLIMIFSGLIVLLILGVILITNKNINPLKDTKELILSMSKGNLSKTQELKLNNEIGEMVTSLNEFTKNIKRNIVNNLEHLANGNINININKLSYEDEITPSLQAVITNLKNLIFEVQNLISQSSEGNLRYRADELKFSGAYKEIITSVNNLLDTILKPIKEGEKVLEIISKGDLRARITYEFSGDFQIIKNSINQVGESLESTISYLSDVVKITDESTQKISNSIENIVNGAQEQSSQINEIAAAIEEMARTIFEISKNINLVADASKQSSLIAQDGGNIVNKAYQGMEEITHVVSVSANKIFKLGERSKEIGEIISVIQEIADQTNLLALNAAIEAARAGEQGRGFAVVADEVKKLAERTTNSTKAISLMIKEIQKETSEAVESMKEGTMKVDSGKIMVNQTQKILSEIINSTDNVSGLIQQVAAASEQQSTATEEINRNIDSINKVAQRNVQIIQEIANSTNELSGLTNDLSGLVSKFIVNKRVQKDSLSLTN